MKLQLNKKKLKNLSKDAQVLPNNMTPNVGGGGHSLDCGPGPTEDYCATQGQVTCDSCGCISLGGCSTYTCY